MSNCNSHISAYLRHPFQVYVDSGAVNKFKQVNWDVIKNKLRNSDSTKEYTDPSTGARVYADVENDERKDTYVLDVTFSVNKN